MARASSAMESEGEEELRGNFETLKERCDELEDANEHLARRLKELLAKVKED